MLWSNRSSTKFNYTPSPNSPKFFGNKILYIKEQRSMFRITETNLYPSILTSSLQFDREFVGPIPEHRRLRWSTQIWQPVQHRTTQETKNLDRWIKLFDYPFSLQSRSLTHSRDWGNAWFLCIYIWALRKMFSCQYMLNSVDIFHSPEWCAQSR